MSHDCEVRDARFVEKHGTVISAGSDGQVQVWNAATGQRRFHLLTGHKGMLTAIEVDEGGDRLLTASDNGEVIAWTLHNGQHLRTLNTGDTLRSAVARSARTVGVVEGLSTVGSVSDPTHVGSSVARKFVTDLCFANVSASQGQVWREAKQL